MKGYAFINNETNIVEYICSWGNEDIASDYPVEANQTIIELQEVNYRRFEDIVLDGKKIKVTDSENLVIEEFIEEVLQMPTLEERLEKAEQDNLDALEVISTLYEQILALQEQVNGGIIA